MNNVTKGAPKHTMHSSRPKSCGEKLLIDMDRIRKSVTGG